jgi:hypothetical protein
MICSVIWSISAKGSSEDQPVDMQVRQDRFQVKCSSVIIDLPATQQKKTDGSLTTRSKPLHAGPGLLWRLTLDS